jgi:hypothetical protein
LGAIEIDPEDGIPLNTWNAFYWITIAGRRISATDPSPGVGGLAAQAELAKSISVIKDSLARGVPRPGFVNPLEPETAKHARAVLERGIDYQNIANIVDAARQWQPDSSTRPWKPSGKCEFSTLDSGVIAAVDRIGKGKNSPLPDPKRSPVAGASTLRFENRTQFTISLYLGGMTHQAWTVSPSSSVAAILIPGTYEIAAEIPGSSLMPMYSKQVFQADSRYEETFVSGGEADLTVKEPKIQDLEIDGKWIAHLPTLQVRLSKGEYQVNRSPDQVVAFSLKRVVGGKLEGTMGPKGAEVQIIDGTISENKLSFWTGLGADAGNLKVLYRGTISGDKIDFVRTIDSIELREEFQAQNITTLMKRAVTFSVHHRNGRHRDVNNAGTLTISAGQISFKDPAHGFTVPCTDISTGRGSDVRADQVWSVLTFGINLIGNNKGEQFVIHTKSSGYTLSAESSDERQKIMSDIREMCLVAQHAGTVAGPKPR